MYLQIERADRRRVAIGLVTVFLGLLWAPAAIGGEGQKAPNEQGAAARVDGQVITVQELEKALAAQLAKLQEQKYQMMQSKLDELIDGRLIEQEAKRRGTTVEALLKSEVSSKVSKVTDLEVSAFINENRARLKSEGPEIRDKVRDYLDYQRELQQRRSFVTSLRQRANVAIFLQEPEPIRAVVSIDGAFVKGPKDAPVTIVEFSDFQCPFCRSSVATLKEVMRQYDGKVRWAFRDFPIPSLHPQAPKAAEAARCAGEQGKSWEYHDLLFDSKAQWTAADFKKFAEQLKLDFKRFGPCLDSGKYQAAVQSDVEDGVRLGINGTPTFFVNGRVLVGAVPLENFRKIVEAELRGKSR
jgi:protein-disulfide isomerase